MAGFVLMTVLWSAVLGQAKEECVYGRSVPKIKAVPPLQYPVQAALVKNFSDTAEEKSAEYTDQLLEILNTVAIREQLNKTCPQLVNVSAQQLMTRIVDELAVSELMHTFSSGCNNQGDTNLQVAAAADYLYSLWQVYFLDIFRGSRFPETILNGAEMQLFRLPAFNTSKKTIPPLDRFPTTFADAGSRLIYTALNYEKVSGPNNGYGDISLIFNRSNVSSMTVISPMDTGQYESKPNCRSLEPVCEGYAASGAIYQKKVDGCYHELADPIHGYPAYQHTTRKWLLFFNPNVSTPPLGHWVIADNLTAHVRSMAKGNGTAGPSRIHEGTWFSWYNNTYREEKTMRVISSTAQHYPNCAAWDRTLGTLDHLNHLIVYKYLMSWGNYSSKHIFPTLKCDPRTKQTVIYGWPYPYPYFEANVIGNVLYPYGVQAVILSFTSLFGTAMGDIAREWCIKHGWILFWSYGATAVSTDLASAASTRLLDPGVLVHSRAGRNYTARQNDTAFFNQYFLEAKRIIIKTKKRPTPTQYKDMWLVLTLGNASLVEHKAKHRVERPTTLAAQPLSAYQCAQPELCVGVTQYDGTCLCVS